MSDFIGYTKRPEPKWPYFILYGAVIVILFFAFSMVPTEKEKPKQEIKETKIENSSQVISQKIKEEKKPNTETNNSPIKIEEIIFTNKLSDSHLPTDNLSSISKSEGRMVYCYTKSDSPSVPITIRHVWIAPNGEVHADIKLLLLKQPGNIWSYVGIGEKQAGTWKVQVKTTDGNILAQKGLLIKD
ncbi:hypothetical protein A2246_06840 [candidate division WOR-1 bacterium RIFOXYA2_FULL_37_7]|uniref:DUF2914 domain-containing protein n=1 Tax=candidate division WOR-1 bacterium RIFOXYB2_FULL_37_13 TaxID=1802579 RepID=A0A1F4SQM3_UNCSA|nr:MAG: hypothetical protein A2246_06840 [candidate division WOR-1 bacterium RIFOXYA2_FULL_37_7]OGC22013.1 MAG: hypothetical protein A2310_06915 [candidate division WOR-1 bacterium RIFOXYB2_FULL_37_13]